jgi:hypothetical protein
MTKQVRKTLEFLGIRKKADQDSEFSLFVRTASSREKKRVFKKVLREASEDQKQVMLGQYAR